MTLATGWVRIVTTSTSGGGGAGGALPEHPARLSKIRPIAAPALFPNILKRRI
jgi:hypothetical protein